MRFAEFSGSAYEIGLQRGKVFRESLLSGYDRFCKYPEEIRKSSEKIVQRMGESLQNVFPEAVEELKGTASGAGMSYEKILLLSFSEELYLACDCSQIAFKQSNVGPIYGKTEDAGFNRTYVISKISPKGRHKVITVGAANWITGSAGGLNEAGLCIGQSSVICTDSNPLGIPRLTLIRYLLERCSNISEALDFLGQNKIAFIGMNYLIIDSSGQMVVVEKSPTKQAVRTSEGSSLCATNHYIAEEMKTVMAMLTGMEPDLDKRLAREANTKHRYSRLFDCGRSYAAGQFGLDEMKRILRSHGIGGLCQHGLMETTFAMIGLPQERKLLITNGPACRSEFFSYEI